jgi:CHASE2 domain-containing sensor protein
VAHLRFVARGTAVALALTLLKMWFETTAWGIELERATVRVLSQRLAPDVPSPLPIVVIDISSADGATVYDAAGAKTSRPFLRKLITAIAAAHPSAVGVDVDFSPMAGDQSVSEDAEFLRWCAAQYPADTTADAAGVPIRLGVGRNSAGPPAGWLGPEIDPRFATTILLDTRSLEFVPYWIALRGAPEAHRLPSLAKALLDEHCGRLAAGSTRLAGCHLTRSGAGLVPAIRTVAIGERVGLDMALFRVDYRSVDALEESVISVSDATLTASDRERIRDRVVLIGSMTDDLDRPMSIPVGEGRQVRGAIVHAAAFLTLINGPIREFTPRARLLIDIGLPLVALSAVTLIAMLVHRRGSALDRQGFARLLGRVIAIAVILVATVLLVRSRILWSDCVVVALALAYHEEAASGMTRAAAAARSFIARTVNRYTH